MKSVLETKLTNEFSPEHLVRATAVKMTYLMHLFRPSSNFVGRN
jgi:hypothetical protein